ncbi:MAG: DUF4177 domain-containing protein [Oscillospiraceae bacterium]|nr:DUF4177 domain-containing protein [Oscillospiraceae bacterium]
MKKFEYVTVTIATGGLFGGKVDADNFNQKLNNMGNQGWELINSISSNEAYGSTKYIVCIFKRELG